MDKVDPRKGAISLARASEIMTDVPRLFAALKRTEPVDCRKPGGWSDDEIADLAEKAVDETGSCLVVVNLKKSARTLYAALRARRDDGCFHLTTGMCPAHRRAVLDAIKTRLDNKLPAVCVSTSLIECGVDISFGAAVMYMAGLDSIVQTGGRCNRNFEAASGKVFVINPADEDLGQALADVREGRACAERILDDYRDAPEAYQNDLSGTAAMDEYYKYYFYNQRDKMDYPFSAKDRGWDDSLLNLLSSNIAIAGNLRRIGKPSDLPLQQAFMTAGDIFKVIDAPTKGVVVPYGEAGKDIINKLCATFQVEKHVDILREAQQYSVNLYPREFDKLKEKGALILAQKDTDIYYMDGKYYSDEFGVSLEELRKDDLYLVSESEKW
jgi:CRISPR-associated endonuclease/helicase Cas3